MEFSRTSVMLTAIGLALLLGGFLLARYGDTVARKLIPWAPTTENSVEIVRMCGICWIGLGGVAVFMLLARLI